MLKGSSMQKNLGTKIGITTLVILVSFMTSCQKTIYPSKDTLVVAIGASPANLDPRRATDAYGMRIASLIHAGLVNLDKNLQPVGELAETWTYSNKVYTFTLRNNAKFSNGRNIEPDDIIFSFSEFMKDGFPYKSALEAIKEVKSFRDADGKVKVQLVLNKFSAKLLTSDLVVVKILPKKELLEQGDKFFDRPIGSGLYQLKDLAINRVLLERSPNHTQGSKFIDFKIIRDEFTRFQKMAQGGLDIAQAEISPSKIRKTFLEDPNKFYVVASGGLSMSYLLFNLTDPLFSNLEVRQAINQSINRQEIIKYKMDGFAKEAPSIVPRSSPFFNSTMPATPFDPAAAKEIIKKHGLLGAKIVLKTSNNQSVMSYAKVMAFQLNQIGLDVTLQSYEWGKFFSDINKGNFQMASLRWVGTVDPDIYRVALHSSELPPGRNRGRYKNVELDKLMEKGLMLEGDSARKQVYDELQRRVALDVPFVPLWYEDQVAIVSKRVKGFDPSPVGDYIAMAYAYKEE
jgi:peptide/nickel transport system substrate-binding protein